MKKAMHAGNLISKKKQPAPLHMEGWRKIEKFIDEDNWAKARQLIRREIKKYPGDHWLMTRLSLTYYEERQYQKALTIAERAHRLMPECPLVLWDYAGCLDMNGREREAIHVWKRLLRRGTESLAYGECGEGLRWARSLLNDCRYRIGLAYADLGKRRSTLFFLRQHLQNRRPFQSSIYDLKEVKTKIEMVKKGVNPRKSGYQLED